MNNQNIQNIKVKRTKEDIRLYHRIYYLQVRRYDENYKQYMKEYCLNNSRTPEIKLYIIYK